MKVKNPFPINMIIYFVLILSGASALIYQVVWMRMLGIVFGVSIYAISAVLTSYMAGLAFGSLIIGKIADKVKKPLFIFVLSEFGIAVYALLFPNIITITQAFLTSISGNLAHSHYLLSLSRFVTSFLILFLPCLLIGGTFPVISKFLVRRLETLGYHIGNIYALYNLGAFIGCFFAGFIMITSLGHQLTIYIAAMLNGLNVLMALFLYLGFNRDKQAAMYPMFKPENPVQNSAEQANRPYSSVIVGIVFWILALEGFCALAYEVIWSRILLGISYDKSIYFYTTVLMVFICGLTFGGFIVSRLLDRKKSLLTLFGGIEILIGILAILLLPIFNLVSNYLTEQRPLYVDSWLIHLGREYFLFFVILLVPVVLMGMTFPIAAKIVISNLKKLGKNVGFLGFMDNAGAIFGSFAAGFLLLPLIGIFKTTFVISLVCIFIGCVLLAINPDVKLRIKVPVGVIVLFILLLSYGFISPRISEKHWFTPNKGERLLYYQEGISGTVAVNEDTQGEKKLYINGSLSAFGEGDLRVDTMRGYLPALLHPHPKNALIIGLGMGVASNSLIQPSVENVTCVEINEAVVDACRYFSDVNQNVLENSRFYVVIDDGRNFLLLNDKKYDLISCNSVHPRLSNVLYTQQFYELCKKRLNPDGIMCQWISVNWMSLDDFKMLVKAFQNVFPNTSLWTVDAGFVLFIATPRPLEIGMSNLIARLNHSEIKQALSDIGVESPYTILAQFVCTGKVLKDYLAEIPPNTDDMPRAEFSKVINKARNPLIIEDMIHFKDQFDDSFLNMDESDDLAINVKNELYRYVQAEKHFIEANVVKFESNQPQEMINLLLQAQELVPTDPRFSEMLSVLYYKNNEFDKALAQLCLLKDQQPNNAVLLDHLGRVYFELNRYDEAKQFFAEASTLKPELPVPHFRLASLYLMDKEYTKSLIELDQVIQYWPDIAEAYFQKGIIYDVIGDFDKSLVSLKKCLEIDKNHQEARAYLLQLQRTLPAQVK